ncbi:MAG: cysteine desulfurase [Armatimonadetes bacterium]|nr:cysteine desulfurase [Armatimonadota bacterium]
MRENYFDNAATTPLDPSVLEEMRPYLTDEFGNANSLHAWGRRASAAVELSRQRVASLLGCEPEEVFFTSGATEANNWIFQSNPTFAVSPFEHRSLFELGRRFDSKVLENDFYLLRSSNCPVAVMLVNNETGAILDVPKPSTGVHRDVTQALGKLPVDLAGVDSASMSAHKLYGPKGVGALFIRDARDTEPLLYGGEQEQGMRAGTLNVPGIVGFGAACEMAGDRMDKDWSYVQSLRETVLEALSDVPGCSPNAHTSNSPYILSVSMLNVEGESLVVEADNQGFAISSGAACSSRSTEPSHVLTALGMDAAWIRGTIRISFSRWNTPDSAYQLGKVLASSVERLRSLGN